MRSAIQAWTKAARRTPVARRSLRRILWHKPRNRRTNPRRRNSIKRRSLAISRRRRSLAIRTTSFTSKASSLKRGHAPLRDPAEGKPPAAGGGHLGPIRAIRASTSAIEPSGLAIPSQIGVSGLLIEDGERDPGTVAEEQRIRSAEIEAARWASKLIRGDLIDARSEEEKSDHPTVLPPPQRYGSDEPLPEGQRRVEHHTEEIATASNALGAGAPGAGGDQGGFLQWLAGQLAPGEASVGNHARDGSGESREPRQRCDRGIACREP